MHSQFVEVSSKIILNLEGELVFYKMIRDKQIEYTQLDILLKIIKVIY